MRITAGPARRLLQAALVAIFPADCYLCREPLPWRQKGGVCLPCWERLPWAPGLRRRNGPLDTIVWGADYDGPFRSLIHGLKFEEMDYLGRHLGEGTAARLAPLLTMSAALSPGRDGEPARPGPDLVVPVPLHWWRRYRRGYNQALLIARALAGSQRLPLAPGLLVRHRAGRRQLGLSRRERLRSLKGCFRLRAPGRRFGPSPEPIAGRRVILVDDVVTTGATLEACAETLVRAGAESVLGCVVARTPPPHHPGAGIRM